MLCTTRSWDIHMRIRNRLFFETRFGYTERWQTFLYPRLSNEVHYETEVVVRICRLGKNIAPRFAHRYYDAVTVGIDFTARDLQRKFRERVIRGSFAKGSTIRQLSAPLSLWNKWAAMYRIWTSI